MNAVCRPMSEGFWRVHAYVAGRWYAEEYGKVEWEDRIWGPAMLELERWASPEGKQMTHEAMKGYAESAKETAGEKTSLGDQVEIRVRFGSIEERNVFLKEHFAERECTETPGLYHVTGWGMVGVHFELVTLYPFKRTVRTANAPEKMKGRGRG